VIGRAEHAGIAEQSGLKLRQRIVLARGRHQAGAQILLAAQPVDEHQNLAAGPRDELRLDVQFGGAARKSGAMGVEAPRPAKRMRDAKGRPPSCRCDAAILICDRCGIQEAQEGPRKVNVARSEENDATIDHLGVSCASFVKSSRRRFMIGA